MFPFLQNIIQSAHMCLVNLVRGIQTTKFGDGLNCSGEVNPTRIGHRMCKCSFENKSTVNRYVKLQPPNINYSRHHIVQDWRRFHLQGNKQPPNYNHKFHFQSHIKNKSEFIHKSQKQTQLKYQAPLLTTRLLVYRYHLMM